MSICISSAVNSLLPYLCCCLALAFRLSALLGAQNLGPKLMTLSIRSDSTAYRNTLLAWVISRPRDTTLCLRASLTYSDSKSSGLRSTTARDLSKCASSKSVVRRYSTNDRAVSCPASTSARLPARARKPTQPSTQTVTVGCRRIVRLLIVVSPCARQRRHPPVVGQRKALICSSRLLTFFSTNRRGRFHRHPSQSLMEDGYPHPAARDRVTKPR